MIAALERHILESTCFALVAVAIVGCLDHRRAAIRHVVLFTAAAKFALPLSCFFAFGASLRLLLPRPILYFPISSMAAAGLPLATHPTQAAGGLLASIGLGLWLSGALLSVAVWISKLGGLGKTQPNTSEKDLSTLQRMQQHLHVRQSISLQIGSADREPQLAGLIHPSIVLPENLSQELTTSEFEAILLHELAHAKRWDNLTRACVHVLTCIFWFHPLLPWLESRIEAESELACDELVVTCGVRPQVYVDGICKICERYLLQPIAGFSNVSGSDLKQRLEYIMSIPAQTRRASRVSTVGALLLTVLLCAAFTLGFVTNTPVQAQSSSNAERTGELNCVIAGRLFPQEAVVRQGHRKQLLRCSQMDGRAKWVGTTEGAQNNQARIVDIPDAPAPATVSCKVTAPDGKFCTCESLRYSPGAVVGSESGPLVCPATGGKWQSYKGTKTPWPPPAISVQ